MSTDPLTSPAPVLSPAERAGLLDFLSVYEANFEEITAGLIDGTRFLSGFARVLSAMSREEIDRRKHAALALIRAAIEHGQWRPLLETRTRQGAVYASLGVSCSEWFDLFSRFQILMTAPLVRALAGDQERLLRALAGMVRYVSLNMNAVAEAYLATRELQVMRCPPPARGTLSN